MVADELGSVGVPTYAILGNHDYQSGLEGDIALLLEDTGIGVLEGRALTLEIDGQRVGTPESKASVAASSGCAPPSSVNRK